MDDRYTMFYPINMWSLHVRT